MVAVFHVVVGKRDLARSRRAVLLAIDQHILFELSTALVAGKAGSMPVLVERLQTILNHWLMADVALWRNRCQIVAMAVRPILVIVKVALDGELADRAQKVVVVPGLCMGVCMGV